MANKCKRFSPEGKVRLLRLHLIEKEPVSDICDRHDPRSGEWVFIPRASADGIEITVEGDWATVHGTPEPRHALAARPGRGDGEKETRLNQSTQSHRTTLRATLRS